MSSFGELLFTRMIALELQSVFSISDDHDTAEDMSTDKVSDIIQSAIEKFMGLKYNAERMDAFLKGNDEHR